MEGTVLKAYNGDRIKNIYGIEEALREVVALVQQRPVADNTAFFIDATLLRRVEGYAEQLGIIADDLTGKAKGRKKA